MTATKRGRPRSPTILCPRCRRVELRCRADVAECACARCRAFKSRHGIWPSDAIVADWRALDDATEWAKLGGSDRVQSVKTVAVDVWAIDSAHARVDGDLELDTRRGWTWPAGTVDDDPRPRRPRVQATCAACHRSPVERAGDWCAPCGRALI